MVLPVGLGRCILPRRHLTSGTQTGLHCFVSLNVRNLHEKNQTFQVFYAHHTVPGHLLVFEKGVSHVSSCSVTPSGGGFSGSSLSTHSSSLLVRSVSIPALLAQRSCMMSDWGKMWAPSEHNRCVSDFWAGPWGSKSFLVQPCLFFVLQCFGNMKLHWSSTCQTD